MAKTLRQYKSHKQSFKFLMLQESPKHRGRIGSEAITAAQFTTVDEASSIQFKPQSDPDAPPQLELEVDLEIKIENSTQFENLLLTQQQNSPRLRSRTRSEDGQYTILGFLQKKIRIRIMSEQLSKIVSLSEYQN